MLPDLQGFWDNVRVNVRVSPRFLNPRVAATVSARKDRFLSNDRLSRFHDLASQKKAWPVRLVGFLIRLRQNTLELSPRRPALRRRLWRGESLWRSAGAPGMNGKDEPRRSPDLSGHSAFVATSAKEARRVGCGVISPDTLQLAAGCFIPGSSRRMESCRRRRTSRTSSISFSLDFAIPYTSISKIK